MQQLAVTGAAGKTGRAVIEATRDAGWEIRALARTEEQAAALGDLGAAAIVGDIGDASVLSKLVGGVDAVYHICPNFHPGEVAVGEALIAAANGIDRLVYHSVLHPQTEAMPHHWRKLRVEELLLKHRPGAATFLRPAPYVQNMASYIEEAATTGELRIPYSVELRSAMVELDDVGRAVVVALGDDFEHGSGWDLCGVVTSPLARSPRSCR